MAMLDSCRRLERYCRHNFQVWRKTLLAELWRGDPASAEHLFAEWGLEDSLLTEGPEEASILDILRLQSKKRGYYDEEGGHSKKMEDSGRAAKENRAKKSAPKEEDGAVQQQAVLESLASYLEGELMIRLQSYTDLVAEVESLNKERLFYYEKLRRVEKACSQAQSYASMPLVESIRAILGATTDRPTP